MSACLNSQTETARILIECGANVNHVNKVCRAAPFNLYRHSVYYAVCVQGGWTAMKFAKQEKLTEIVSLLKDAGAKK